MVVDTQLYNLLGVSPDASDRELKKAFLKKARETHPDKNQDDPQATEKFQAINEAYKILSDPKKRSQYDKYGLDGLREDEDLDINDFINHLFNIDPEYLTPKTKDITKKVSVTLEEEYNGSEKTISVQRHIMCPTCHGSGCKPGKKSKLCAKCKGQGEVLLPIKKGNRLLQKVISCPLCGGLGEIIPKDDQCPTCNGERVVEDDKEITIHVERGSESGDSIVFQGISDEVPDAEPGDVVVILHEEPHPVFERKAANLLLKKHISLSEAIFGAKFAIQHLDGRKLIVESATSDVIANGSVEVIQNEGMPIKGDPFKKGCLFIEYIVDLPRRDQISETFKNALLKEIPIVDETKKFDLSQDDVCVAKTEPAKIDAFRNLKKENKTKRKDAFGEEEEEEEEEYLEVGSEAGCPYM